MADLSTFTRVIDNLYTAVFERGKGEEKRNSVSYKMFQYDANAYKIAYSDWTKIFQGGAEYVWRGDRTSTTSLKYWTSATTSANSTVSNSWASGNPSYASDLASGFGYIIYGNATPKLADMHRVSGTIAALTLYMAVNWTGGGAADYSAYSTNGLVLSLAQPDTGSMNHELGFYKHSSGQVRLAGYDGSGVLTYSTYQLDPTNANHYYYVTVEYGVAIKVYVDGVLQLSMTAPTPATNYIEQYITFGTPNTTFTATIYHASAYPIVPSTLFSDHERGLVTTGATAVDDFVYDISGTPSTGTQLMPSARYYTQLTPTSVSTGAVAAGNTQLCAIFTTTGAKVAYVPGVLDTTQAWLAIRLQPSWASSDVNTYTIFNWGSGTDYLKLVYNNGNWSFTRSTAAGNSTVTVAASHAAYDSVQLVITWTSTTIRIALNSPAAFTSAANTNIPTLTVNWEIGGALYAVQYTQVIWVMAGVGTLSINTAQNLALVNYLTRKPEFTDLPNMVTTDPSFYWRCESTTEHDAFGIFGESFYA